MSGGLAWLPQALAELRDADLLRELTYCASSPGPEVSLDGEPHLLLASNNYLGLAAHPAVIAGAHEAIDRYGVGAGASRLVTGSLDLHRRLEERLAILKSCEDALVFPTGYQANVGTIPVLAGPGDTIFSDELNHASIIDGCRLSRAEVVRYPHADADALERAVRSGSAAGRRLIVTDAVFSMDGDLAPLPDLVDIADRHGCTLMVDEAHATGVLGPSGAGAIEHFGLGGRVPVVMGTLSKALGAQGGYVATSRELADLLRTRARGFVFTTALAPAAVGAALAALDVVRDEPWRRERVHANARRLADEAQALGFEVLPSDAAVVGVLVGEAVDALAAGAALRDERVWAPAIRPPSVPPGTSRLRLTVMASHEDAHIDWALRGLAAARRTVAA